MRKELTEKIRAKKGITLIALVITIVVLLILAGVSIAMLTGENGLLNKAKTAKDNHETSAAEEALKTELMGILANQQGETDLNNLNGLNIDGYTVQTSNIGKIITMTTNHES